MALSLVVSSEVSTAVLAFAAKAVSLVASSEARVTELALSATAAVTVEI